MPQAAASTTREINFFHAERKSFKYKTLGWAGAGAHNPKGRSVELVIPPVVKWHLQERWNQHTYTSLTLLPFGLWAPGRGQPNTCLIETKNLGMSRPNPMPGISNPVNCSGKKTTKNSAQPPAHKQYMSQYMSLNPLQECAFMFLLDLVLSCTPGTSMSEGRKHIMIHCLIVSPQLIKGGQHN